MLLLGSSRFNRLILCCSLAFVAVASLSAAEKLAPVQEGWIRSSDPNTVWTKKVPETLGIRLVGTEKAWATFLEFDLRDIPKTATIEGLAFEFAGQNTEGEIKLYGVADALWESSKLKTANAPGWDSGTHNVAENVRELSRVIIGAGSTQTAPVFPMTPEFHEFIEQHRESSVTFILVKKGTSSTMLISSRGDPSRGPRLEFTP